MYPCPSTGLLGTTPSKKQQLTSTGHRQRHWFPHCLKAVVVGVPLSSMKWCEMLSLSYPITVPLALICGAPMVAKLNNLVDVAGILALPVPRRFRVGGNTHCLTYPHLYGQMTARIDRSQSGPHKLSDKPGRDQERIASEKPSYRRPNCPSRPERHLWLRLRRPMVAAFSAFEKDR
jgi:hypothetical protein